MEFQVGETVMMKSGSHIMVVSSVDDKNAYLCRWWGPTTLRIEEAYFEGHLLKLVHQIEVVDALRYQIDYIAAYNGGK